jgi:hypothetical protein
MECEDEERAERAATDARPKRPNPARNALREPIRSPSQPAVSSSPANVTMYTSTTRCGALSGADRSRPMPGSATLMIVESTITMNQPTESAASGRPSKVVAILVRMLGLAVASLHALSRSPRPTAARSSIMSLRSSAWSLLLDLIRSARPSAIALSLSWVASSAPSLRVRHHEEGGDGGGRIDDQLPHPPMWPGRWWRSSGASIRRTTKPNEDRDRDLRPSPSGGPAR